MDVNSFLEDIGFDSLTVRILTDDIEQTRIFAAKSEERLDKERILLWLQYQSSLDGLQAEDWRALQGQLRNAGFGLMEIDLRTVNQPEVTINLL